MNIEDCKVGDEVLLTLYDDANYKSEVLILVNDDYEYDYLIKIPNDWNNKTHIMLVKERYLLPIKNKDELEVGDKFIDLLECEYKVIAIDYDDYFDHVSYFVKKIDRNFQGRITVKKPSNIKEIIYE